MAWRYIFESIPPVQWIRDKKSGKKYFSPIPIILLRKLEFRMADPVYCFSIGEYDTGSIPHVWRTWNEHIDKNGFHEAGGQIVEDVIAWDFLPNWPNIYPTENENFHGD